MVKLDIFFLFLFVLSVLYTINSIIRIIRLVFSDEPKTITCCKWKSTSIRAPASNSEVKIHTREVGLVCRFTSTEHISLLVVTEVSIVIPHVGFLTDAVAGCVLGWVMFFIRITGHTLVGALRLLTFNSIADRKPVWSSITPKMIDAGSCAEARHSDIRVAPVRRENSNRRTRSLCWVSYPALDES